MRILLLVLLALLSAASRAQTRPAASPAAAAILGRWLTADKAGIIQIYAQQGRYAGKIVGPEPPRLDANNPDPALRQRPLLGVVMLQGFRYDGAGAWANGTIYDPRNGKTYSCILRLKTASALEVRGYVGVSLLGRTEVWTRLP
jgi:uncharacterized protein (DUF2147 family)